MNSMDFYIGERVICSESGVIGIFSSFTNRLHPNARKTVEYILDQIKIKLEEPND